MNLVLECVLKCFFVGEWVLPELQQICGVQFGSGTNPGGHVTVSFGATVIFLCGWPLGVLSNTHLPHFRLCVSDWCSPEWEDLIRYYSCHCVCTVKLENLSIITRQ